MAAGISDEAPDVPRARVFDPLKHSFNPLANLDYRKAREIADILYTVSPQDENTLTVRNGKRALLKMSMDAPERLDRLPRDSVRLKQARSKRWQLSMTS